MSSNPAYIGPGYWASWHIKGLKADTREKKLELARCISIDVLYFPCEACQKDASEYIRTNSMYTAINSDDPFSMFNYTVDFHNYVNLKLKKSIGTLDYENARIIWTKHSSCFNNCGLEEEDIKEESYDGEESEGSEGSEGSEESNEITIKSY